jgi:basic membrane lipoprotein Med (substrate-binding protein (PBP1-ABC) superfamily)
MNRRLNMTILLALAAVLIALAGCPAPRGQGGTQQTASAPLASPIDVVLVLTDLGIGDGSYAREADATLKALDADGRVSYTAVGELPSELSVEGISGDVGLPASGAGSPGAMDLTAAEALFANVPDCELLVLTSPLVLDRALSGITAGEYTADAVLLLDNDGYTPPEEAPPVPVYVVRYGIKDVAFLSGVAAAQSANVSMFVALAAQSDPQAEDYLSAVRAGARFQSSGATVETAVIPVDPELGYVTPELFLEAIRQLREEAGPYFQTNHYMINLGRATPTVMLAMSSDPDNAYVIGAYADYRRVRPARVVGCALKLPGNALDHILRQVSDVGGLAGLATDAVIELGLNEDAVGFTDFELYGRYNPDSEDIRQVVERIESLIRVDELDYDY